MLEDIGANCDFDISQVGGRPLVKIAQMKHRAEPCKVGLKLGADVDGMLFRNHRGRQGQKLGASARLRLAIRSMNNR